MNMMKLIHKPTGRALIISVQHGEKLVERKQQDYEEVELVAPAPVVEEVIEEAADEKAEEAKPTQVSKKKTVKKKSS